MKLDKIKLALQNILAQFSKVSTDKGILQYDGDELVEGIDVRLFDTETETESKPEDGEYYLGEEDGRKLVVEDGKITKIIEPDDESESVEEDKTNENMSAKQEKFNKVKELYEESYEEKERKIIEAIRSLGFDCWLIEAGEDYAVVESWNEEAGDYKHLRFSISWDGEGNAVAGDFEEVKPAFVPVSEDVPATVEEEEMSAEQPQEEEVVEDKPQEEVEEVNVDELKLKLEQFSKENEELKAKLAELQKPAQENAKEEFKKVNKFVSTGNDKLDNLMRYCK